METTVIDTGSLEQTVELGSMIGSHCRGGEVFELVSDLGGGKTAFTRGLVAGIGSNDEVTSPSFTINNTYKTGRLIVEHFDFYRLSDAGVVGEELKEALGQKDIVVVIEWGNIVRDSLGDTTVRVQITPLGEDSRRFNISYPSELAYLLEAQL